MAYIPGVKNDLFISYAHVDNEPDAYDKRWVSDFVRSLGVEVRQRLGGPKDFALFFDESDLHAHHHLPILLENARQSAVFVAILSPSYVSHDWTMKELSEFAGMASDQHRIIVVEKLPLEFGEPYPAEIDQNRRTPFWRRNEPESYAPSTLTPAGTPAQYRQTLETLGHQVQQLLREMRRSAEAPKPGVVTHSDLVVAVPKPAPELPPIIPAAGVPSEQSPSTLRSASARAPEPAAVTIPSPITAPERPDRERTRQPKMPSLPKGQPGSSLIFDLIWPRTDTNRIVRVLAALATVAAISFALAWAFRAATTYPANAFGAITCAAIGSAVFHLIVSGLGTRLAVTSAIIVVIAIWSAAIQRMPANDLSIFACMFAAIIVDALIVSVGVERGRAQGYRRLLIVTLAGSAAGMSIFLLGVAIIVGIKNDFLQVAAISFCMVAGYSIVAAGLTELVRRRFQLTQTP